jgi:hypothetical protein
MNGSILAAVRADAHRIVTSGGFQTDLSLKQGTNDYVTVQGLGLIHHLTFDTDGAPVNSKQVHVTATEIALNAAGITVRNAKNEVMMVNTLVKFADVTGIEKTYIIKENFADETIGVIFLMLGKYAE